MPAGAARVPRRARARVAPTGARRRYTIYGGTAGYRREEGTDFAAIEAGEIAVTPMHFDLTDIAGMDHLERRSLADLLEADPAVGPA